MLPPQSLFEEDADKQCTAQLIKTIKSREFLAVALGTILCSGLAALTLFVGYDFFHLIVYFLTVTVCFLIFATFIFAQSSYLDGFFVFLGLGYFFVGLLLMLSQALILGLVSLNPGFGQLQIALQVELLCRLVETISWAAGLAFAHRSFRGYKIPIIFTILMLTLISFSWPPLILGEYFHL